MDPAAFRHVLINSGVMTPEAEPHLILTRSCDAKRFTGRNCPVCPVVTGLVLAGLQLSHGLDMTSVMCFLLPGSVLLRGSRD